MSDSPGVLYLGDDSLAGAASYLAAVMTHSGVAYTHRGSSEDACDLIDGASFDCYVLSDYPSNRLGDRGAGRLLKAVHGGAGLLMIGGWESFRGSGGGYDASPITEALPVAIARSDDRMNWCGPCVVRKRIDHPVCDGLDFDPAPSVAGFNRLEARSGTDVVLAVDRYAPHPRESDGVPAVFELLDSHPLLVCGRYGEGRTAAFASDAAPHWVGGFVDWGPRRVSIVTDAFDVEVGESYVRFFSHLIAWLRGG